jgi:hypothetical protein
MVKYFRPRRHGPARDDYLLYMGRDKVENEELIRHALPHDVWFHVDALSSAHVYLRLPEGATLDSIDEEVLEDAAQLVKANSIRGNKENNLQVVYTPAPNLLKTGDMAVGQVGFRDDRLVRKVRVERRKNEVINRLEKTEEERVVDLAEEKEAWLREERGKARAAAAAARRAEKAAAEAHRAAKEARSYNSILGDEAVAAAAEQKEKYATAEDYEDDFMT